MDSTAACRHIHALHRSTGTALGGIGRGDRQSVPAGSADGVAVVVQTVGTNHPFRSAGLNLSVTTDDVVVADAEVKASFPVPRINLCRGTRLVGPYCTAVNNNQCNRSHFSLSLTYSSVQEL